MNTITHCLLPVIAAAFYQRHHAPAEKHKTHFSVKEMIIIGAFGAAPDIINPHLSLASRLTSWSHSLSFWGVLAITVLVFRFLKPGVLSTRLSIWILGAYLFHLFCDAIAGGIAWQYPFGNAVIGDYYFSPTLWIPADFICLVAVYFLYRALPNIYLLKTSKNKEKMPPTAPRS